MQTTLVLAVFLSAVPPLPAADPRGAIEADLARLASPAKGVVGVHAIHVESGRSVSLNASDRYPMASTYKVPIALAVLHQVDVGTIRLDERLAVEREDLRAGGGEELVKAAWKPGFNVSVEELLERMLRESDNTATDLLFKRLGGPETVRLRLAELGFGGIAVARTELQLGSDYYGVTVPKDQRITIEAVRALRKRVPAAKQKAAAEAWDRDTRDTTTPKEMAELLVKLTKGQLLSRPSTERLLDWMRRNKTGDKRLRALLPKGTEVLDKTGTGGRSTNDIGILTLPDGTHVAVAVYVKWSQADDETREKVIAEAGRAVWEAFGKNGVAR